MECNLEDNLVLIVDKYFKAFRYAQTLFSYKLGKHLANGTEELKMINMILYSNQLRIKGNSKKIRLLYWKSIIKKNDYQLQVTESFLTKLLTKTLKMDLNRMNRSKT